MFVLFINLLKTPSFYITAGLLTIDLIVRMNNLDHSKNYILTINLLFYFTFV